MTNELIFFRLTPKGLGYLAGNYTLDSEDESELEILHMIDELGAPGNLGAGWSSLVQEYADYRYSDIHIDDLIEDYTDDLRSQMSDFERKGLVQRLRSGGPDEGMVVQSLN